MLGNIKLIKNFEATYKAWGRGEREEEKVSDK